MNDKFLTWTFFVRYVYTLFQWCKNSNLVWLKIITSSIQLNWTFVYWIFGFLSRTSFFWYFSCTRLKSAVGNKHPSYFLYRGFQLVSLYIFLINVKRKLCSWANESKDIFLGFESGLWCLRRGFGKFDSHRQNASQNTDWYVQKPFTFRPQPTSSA